MLYGSIFCGVGGFDLACRRMGWKCAWQIENDPRCNEVLEYRWPQVKRYGDIRDVKTEELARVELVCAGFPCTDVSVAGLRSGLGGKQTGLFFHLLHIIAAISPRWVWLENVPGLVSSWSDEEVDSEGRIWQRNDFETVLSSLSELGYNVGWRTLDAQFFGLAQRRARVFFVGHLRDVARLPRKKYRSYLRRLPGVPLEVLFEPESCEGDIKSGKQKRTDIARTIAQGTHSTGYRCDASHETFVTQEAEEIAFSSGGYGHWSEGPGTLRTKGDADHTAHLITHNAYQCHGNNVGKMGTLRAGNSGDCVPFIGVETTPPLTTRYNAGSDGGSRGFPIVAVEGDVAHTLTARHDSSEDGRGRGVPLVVDGALPIDGAAFDVRNLQVNNEVSATIQAKATGGQSLNYQNPIIVRVENSGAEGLGVLEDGTTHTLSTGGVTDAVLEPPGEVYAVIDRGRNGERSFDYQKDLSYALTSPGDGGRSNSRQVAGNFGVRRLTPRETERLQGFADDYTKYGIRKRRSKFARVEIKDSARYKMMGNAVAVPVVTWLAERIDNVEKELQLMLSEIKGR